MSSNSAPKLPLHSLNVVRIAVRPVNEEDSESQIEILLDDSVGNTYRVFSFHQDNGILSESRSMVELICAVSFGPEGLLDEDPSVKCPFCLHVGHGAASCTRRDPSRVADLEQKLADAEKRIFILEAQKHQRH